MKNEYDFSNGIRGSVLLRRAYEKALREAFRTSKPHFADETWPADGRLDYYGFAVRNISEDGSTVEVDWIFKQGETYCCEESGCHTVLTFKGGNEKTAKRLAEKWALIRGFLPKAESISKITLMVTHTLEAGCRLDSSHWVETVATTRNHKYIWKEPA
jgi:hypothetical protein